MEILFISHKYPPTIGGMEKQCYELIAQAEKNHIVHKIVHNSEEESKFSFLKNLKSRVKKILAAHPSIQVIHLNDGLMGIFTYWIKSYTNIPVVVTFHGLDLVFPNYFYQRLIKNKHSKYAGAICVSTATKNDCLERNFNPEKVFVVPNGVDHSIAEYQSDEAKINVYFKDKYDIDLKQKKIIATLGRPVQRKGFSWFLQNVIPNLDDDVITIMVGPLAPKKKKKWWQFLLPNSLLKQIELATGGLSDEENIQTILKDEKLKKKVIQTGKLPFGQVLDILTIADLFVMPNLKKWGDAEGFGLVALEASLRKTVVLASKLEGIPEAIQNNKNGFLLPSGDAKVWTETVKKMLEEKSNLNKKGEEFQKFTLQNYGWEKMTNGYLDVFEKIINQN